MLQTVPYPIFLEQQAELDPERFGVDGCSLGGNLTMDVAGTESRAERRSGRRYPEVIFGIRTAPAEAIDSLWNALMRFTWRGGCLLV